MGLKNQTIAEFMAGKPVKTHHNQYHTSFNELMPVVHRCFQTETTYDNHKRLEDVLIANYNDIDEWLEAIRDVVFEFIQNLDESNKIFLN